MKINNKWYTGGGVTVQNGSTTVNGSETYWLEADIKQGDIFVLDNIICEISQVLSSTQLILAQPFTGQSKEAAAYAIIKRAPQVLAAYIAYKLGLMIDNWDNFITEYKQEFENLKSKVKILEKLGLYIDEDGDFAQDTEHSGEDLSPDISPDKIATDDDVDEVLDEIFGDDDNN